MSSFITRLAFLGRAMGSTTSTAASSSYSTMSSQIKQLVDSTVDDNFIAVFSKSYCPYCRRAKSLINSLSLPEGKQVKVYELDQMKDGSAIQAYLERKTGQSTVPNIFINREHIGGSDDLAALEQAGQLKKIIARAAGSN